MSHMVNEKCKLLGVMNVITKNRGMWMKSCCKKSKICWSNCNVKIWTKSHESKESCRSAEDIWNELFELQGK